MTKKNTIFVLGLLILIFTGFTACRNTIMEGWWPSPDTRPPTVFHRVTFDAGSQYSDPGDQLIVHDGKIAKVPAMLSVSGHGFAGWFSDINLNNEWVFSRDTVTSDLTLYAKWVEAAEEELYFIVFNAGSGNPEPPRQITVRGATIVEPTSMRRGDISTGWWGFGGWYTSRDFRPENEWNFSTNRLTDEVIRNSVVNVDGEQVLTLHARWLHPPGPPPPGPSETPVPDVTENHRRINFEANGGFPIPRE
jgi:uncharacterized repeat protein (TIGR02543 family)